MKRVTVKTLTGSQVDSSSVADPNKFISDGIMSGKWGDPSKIQFFVEDISKDSELKEKRNKEKRKGLIQDYAALNPKRKSALRRAIDVFMLQNFPIDVEDV